MKRRVEKCGDQDCMECENERLRAENRDLKARLRAVRATECLDNVPESILSDEEVVRWRATDLRVKNWRKP